MLQNDGSIGVCGDLNERYGGMRDYIDEEVDTDMLWVLSKTLLSALLGSLCQRGYMRHRCDVTHTRLRLLYNISSLLSFFQFAYRLLMVFGVPLSAGSTMDVSVILQDVVALDTGGKFLNLFFIISYN